MKDCPVAATCKHWILYITSGHKILYPKKSEANETDSLTFKQNKQITLLISNMFDNACKIDKNMPKMYKRKDRKIGHCAKHQSRVDDNLKTKVM